MNIPNTPSPDNHQIILTDLVNRADKQLGSLQLGLLLLLSLLGLLLPEGLGPGLPALVSSSAPSSCLDDKLSSEFFDV